MVSPACYFLLETVSCSVGAAWGVQGSQSRLRDENFLEKQETRQTAKHVAAEQVPALSWEEWAQGSPESARQANEEVSATRQSLASPGASRFNTEQPEQGSGLAMGRSRRGWQRLSRPSSKMHSRCRQTHTDQTGWQSLRHPLTWSPSQPVVRMEQDVF